MKEQLIAFETARLAKEKEFGYEFNKSLPSYVPIFYCEFDNDDNLDLTTLKESDCQGEDIVRCDFYFRSSQSLLQKWLREVHNIHITLFPEDEDDKTKTWTSKLYTLNFGSDAEISYLKHGGTTLTFEEALEIGLQEALKLI